MASESASTAYSADKLGDYWLRVIAQFAENYLISGKVHYAQEIARWVPALVEKAQQADVPDRQPEIDALAALLATAQEAEETQRQCADTAERALAHAKNQLVSAQARADLAEKSRDHHYERAILLEEGAEARDLARDSELKVRILDLERQVGDLNDKLALRIEVDLKRREKLDELFNEFGKDMLAIFQGMREAT